MDSFQEERVLSHSHHDSVLWCRGTLPLYGLNSSGWHAVLLVVKKTKQTNSNAKHKSLTTGPFTLCPHIIFLSFCACGCRSDFIETSGLAT